jgi:hypothetical protein
LKSLNFSCVSRINHISTLSCVSQLEIRNQKLEISKRSSFLDSATLRSE